MSEPAGERTERTDHDDPDMYRHRDDPEPDAGERRTDGGTTGS